MKSVGICPVVRKYCKGSSVSHTFHSWFQFTTLSVCNHKVFSPHSVHQRKVCFSHTLWIGELDSTNTLRTSCYHFIPVSITCSDELVNWVCNSLQTWRAALRTSHYLFDGVYCSLCKDSALYNESFVQNILLSYDCYRILPSKHPWALEIHRPKDGVGAYTYYSHLSLTLYAIYWPRRTFAQPN